MRELECGEAMFCHWLLSNNPLSRWQHLFSFCHSIWRPTICSLSVTSYVANRLFRASEIIETLFSIPASTFPPNQHTAPPDFLWGSLTHLRQSPSSPCGNPRVTNAPTAGEPQPGCCLEVASAHKAGATSQLARQPARHTHFVLGLPFARVRSPVVPP